MRCDALLVSSVTGPCVHTCMHVCACGWYADTCRPASSRCGERQCVMWPRLDSIRVAVADRCVAMTTLPPPVIQLPPPPTPLRHGPTHRRLLPSPVAPGSHLWFSDGENRGIADDISAGSSWSINVAQGHPVCKGWSRGG